MIRSVTFPLRTQSENAYRGVAFAIASLPKKRQMGAAHGIDRKRAKQRETVRLVLDSQFTRPQASVPSGHGYSVMRNRFQVTITRIAVGTLDADNLAGALKGVADEVAAWLGLDDRSDRITWRRLQQRCKSGGWRLAGAKYVRLPAYQGLRIEVVDLEVGEDQVRHVGPAPTLLGEPEEQPQRGRPGVTAGRAKRTPKTVAERRSDMAGRYIARELARTRNQ